MRVGKLAFVVAMAGVMACSESTGPTSDSGGGGGGGGGGAGGATTGPSPRSDPGAPTPGMPGEGTTVPCPNIPLYVEPVDGPIKC